MLSDAIGTGVVTAGSVAAAADAITAESALLAADAMIAASALLVVSTGDSDEVRFASEVVEVEDEASEVVTLLVKSSEAVEDDTAGLDCSNVVDMVAREGAIVDDIDVPESVTSEVEVNVTEAVLTSRLLVAVVKKGVSTVEARMLSVEDAAASDEDVDCPTLGATSAPRTKHRVNV